MEDPTKGKSCSVCFSDFKKFRRAIICPFCDVLTCRDCVKDYLLGSPQDAHCMACKHQWNYAFMYNSFPETFLTGEYRKSRQRLALEREKALLPDTLPLVDEEKKKIEIQKEVQVITKKKAVYMERIRKLKNKTALLDFEIRERKNSIKDVRNTIKRVQYIGPCPADKCRGFIEPGTHRCGLCEIYICRKCHEILGMGEENLKKLKKKHTCDKNTVASVKDIKKMTKPCPKCQTPIFKIIGCDQMFCTQCRTPFSWNTGDIITGVIHNPHYYEMMRNMGTAVRNVGDVPCGGLPMHHQLNQFLQVLGEMNYFHNYEKTPDNVQIFMSLVHRRAGEIDAHITRRRREVATANNKAEQRRLDFLVGKIKTEKEFQAAIFRDERMRQKKEEESQILSTFLAGVIERMSDFIQTCAEETEKKGVLPTKKFVEDRAIIFMKDVKKMIRFCNKAFQDNYTAMSYKKFPQIVLTTEYTTARLFDKRIIVGKEPGSIKKKGRR